MGAIKDATKKTKEIEYFYQSAFGINNFIGSISKELTDERKNEIDAVGKSSFLLQAIEEIKTMKFPSSVETIRQAGLLILILVVTTSIIVKVDIFLNKSCAYLEIMPN